MFHAINAIGHEAKGRAYEIEIRLKSGETLRGAVYNSDSYFLIMKDDHSDNGKVYVAYDAIAYVTVHWI